MKYDMERIDKMRILIDTNILFSALLFPRSKPALALLHVANHHEMVLCDRNIAELHDILKRKAPKYDSRTVSRQQRYHKVKIRKRVLPILF